jgi:hypothetical protein
MADHDAVRCVNFCLNMPSISLTPVTHTLLSADALTLLQVCCALSLLEHMVPLATVMVALSAVTLSV